MKISPLFVPLALLSIGVQATNLDHESVTELVDSICGNFVTRGASTKESVTFERDQIPDELLEELKSELSEQFDDVIITNESITFKSESYTGIRQEDLAEHNSNVQECRKKVGLAAINSQIQQSKK